MKNYTGGKIVFVLFMLLFVSFASAQSYIIPNFPKHKQEGTLTCWAANIRMVTHHYGVVMEEEEIRSIARNGNTGNQRNTMWRGDTSVSRTLARLMLNTSHRYGDGAVASNEIPGIINSNRPIIAGIRGLRSNNNGGLDTSMHMYPIIGYAGTGNSMDVRWVNSLDTNDQDVVFNYSLITGGTDSRGVKRDWLEYIYMSTSPKAPNQTVVGKYAKFNTIYEGLEKVKTNGIVHLLDTGPFEEQVILNRTNPGIIITPTPNNTYRPTIKLPNSFLTGSSIEENSTLLILNTQGIGVFDTDISGSNGYNAIYNTGTVTLRRTNATAESGYGIYNTGTSYIEYGTFSSTSNYAMYNTGSAMIDDATISTASDTAIYNRGLLDIANTVLRTASGNNGIAIYNSVSNGLLYLGGDLTITGRIAGFNAGRVIVYASGSYRFNPGNKKYLLSPANLKNGDVVVVNGAAYINNFELDNADFDLMAEGNNLVARCTQCVVSFDLNGGTGTAPSNILVPYGSRLGTEQEPSTENFTRTGYVNDGKWYSFSNFQYREFVFGVNGTSVTDNTTLYLQWTVTTDTVPTAPTNYTVSFNLNGGTGTVPNNIVVASGSRLSTEQMPSTAGFTRTGFVNDGKWYTLSNSEYNEFVFGTNGTQITSNTTLYLQWTTKPDTTYSNRFTAGPNPASKQVGVINFFWEGEEIKNGMLSIYNASGNLIRKINVNNDKKISDFSRRVICSWDMLDQSSRPVPAGNYLVVGTVTTRDSKKEAVSVMLSVR